MSSGHTGVAGFLLDGKDPGRIALRLLERDYTYGELRSASGEIARRLRRLACCQGDRVILAGENSFFWVSAYLGTLRAGCVCVPLPTSVPAEDLEYILKTTEAKVVFADVAFAMRNRHHLQAAHLVTDREAPEAGEAVGDGSPPVIEPGDLAALMFTSGSTGRPRGVMISHANIVANTNSIVQYLELTDADRILTVLPFHYCFGASLLHTHLRVGGSLILEPRFVYPEVVLQRMLETQATGFAGVPSHFQILVTRSSLRSKRPPHLRYVQQAGGHLAPRFVRELREALPETKIFLMYGQTEATARLSYLPPELLDKKPGSVGRGIPGVKLTVMNEAGKEVAPGETGEIVAEGANVAAGYWRAPEESAVSFRGGKLYTGDLAQIDEEGYIYVVARSKDVLKCGGKRVSCRQVEDQLLGFEDLLEAAVIGVPDGVLGEAVKAFVVPRAEEPPGLEERLRLFCRGRMPAEVVPKEIVVVPSLPKNSAGKVLKQELRGMAWGTPGALKPRRNLAAGREGPPNSNAGTLTA